MHGDDPDDGVTNPWASIVGPSYTVGSFSRVLKLSEVAVFEAAAELRVLCLRTSDGCDLFPAFQIRDGHVVPELKSVLTVLRSAVDDPWWWARWLNTPRHDGVVHIHELWAGRIAEVTRAAEHDAWAWRS